MGVHGLWRLIEPSGNPVPLETLENKVLAVDISIWLHQAVKGFQDSKGAPLPNAHLLGIYHRVCKLLYFKIKPVFVFDGGVPVLKRETIAKRNQLRANHANDANKIQKQILNTLLRHTAVNKVLSEQTKSQLPVKIDALQEPQKDDDLFKLPPSQLDSTISSSDDDDYTSTSDSSPTKYWDIHTLDEKSSQFRSLPADIRHEILTDLKETRKQSSWGRIHELPTESNEFSGYQMKRLLKRFSIQSSLEETEKEMGGHSLSLKELESLLNDQGVVTGDSVGNRIASDENTRYLYIKDVKKALEKARLENLKPIQEECDINDVINCLKDGAADSLDRTNTADSTQEDLRNIASSSKGHSELNDDLEYQRDLNLAIQLSLQEDVPGSSKSKTKNTASAQSSDLKKFSAAMGYMMEYGGLTPAGVNEILLGKHRHEESFVTDGEKSLISKLLEDSSLDITEEREKNLSINEDNTDKKSSLTNKEIIESIRIEDDKVIKEKSVESISASTKQIIVESSSDSSSDNDNDFLDVTESDKKSLKNKEISDGTTIEDDTITKEIRLLVTNESNGNKGAESISTSTKPAIVNSNSANDFLEAPESVKSVSSDDDFVEVPEGEESNVEADSGSEDHFFEVPQKAGEKMLEVIIDKDKVEQDEEDIFSDIFSPGKPTLIDLNEIIQRNNKAEIKNADDDGNLNSGKTSGIDLSRLMENKTEKKKVGFLLKTDEEVAVDESKNASEEKVVVDKTEKPETIVEIRKATPSLSTDELKQMQSNYEKEQENLIVQRANKERLANNITDQMYQEAQELLQLFGVPYIIAPMEAEAQCAFLNEANLTDGTITDDSDIWLFGGKTVYKNFFNQSKRVMEFRSENIEHHFKLSRLKLIQLSLLVGSDYTVGLQGVGPVTALEILAAFPSYNENAALSHQQVISGLIRFRNWFKQGKIAGPGKAALRTKLRNLEVTESFPSANVARAYIEPEVENSKEKFSWGKPDIIALTDYAKQKFGWSQKKSEEILKPVVKRLQESKMQSTIKDYFKTKHKIDVSDLSERMSKRVKSAVTRIGKGDEAEEVITNEGKSRGRKKKIVEGETETGKKPKKNDAKETENKIIDPDKKSNKTKVASRNKEKNTKSNKKQNDTNQDADVSECEEVESKIDDNEQFFKNATLNPDREKLHIPTTRYTKKLKPVQKPVLNKLDEIRNTLQKSFIARKQTPKKAPVEEEIDEDLLELHKVEIASTSKVKEIEDSVKKELEKNVKRTLHAKAVIHQKERDKSEMMRSKLRAIETFRKSKNGPGYVKKRAKIVRQPKDDAELSEESSED